MLQVIQNNLKSCPNTLSNLAYNKLLNGIELNDKELECFNKDLPYFTEYELIENGCKLTNLYGDFYWYKNGAKHREDGPAIELTTGLKEYYINGLRHYYLNGKKYYSEKKILEEDKCWK